MRATCSVLLCYVFLSLHTAHQKNPSERLWKKKLAGQLSINCLNQDLNHFPSHFSIQTSTIRKITTKTIKDGKGEREGVYGTKDTMFSVHDPYLTIRTGENKRLFSNNRSPASECDRLGALAQIEKVCMSGELHGGDKTFKRWLSVSHTMRRALD